MSSSDFQIRLVISPDTDIKQEVDPSGQTILTLRPKFYSPKSTSPLLYLTSTFPAVLKRAAERYAILISGATGRILMRTSSKDAQPTFLSKSDAEEAG